MNRPTISVVIAAYCGERFIAEQLRSLYRQTLPPDEILIGDDSDDDLTERAAAETFAESPCTVKWIKNPTRLGCPRNFANLAEKASGDLIFFCDQDDFWLPEKIRTFSEEFERYPETAVIFCNSRFTDPELKDLGYSTADMFHLTPEYTREINETKNFREFLRTPVMYGHNIAFRRSFRDCFLPLPERVTSHDLYWCFVTSALAKCRHLPQELTLFRRHGSNSSAQRKETLLQRAITLWKNQKDCRELQDSRDHAEAAVERLQSMTEYVDPEMFVRLQKTARYFQRRLDHASGNIFRRMMLFSFLGDYLRYGNGFRSLVRDLLIGCSKPNQ